MAGQFSKTTQSKHKISAPVYNAIIETIRPNVMNFTVPKKTKSVSAPAAAAGGVLWAEVIEMPAYDDRAFYTCRLVDDDVADYNPATNYIISSVCIGSDNLKYVSIQVDEGTGFNTGHDPVSSPTWWEQSEEIKIEYNQGYDDATLYPDFDIRDCAIWFKVGMVKEIVSRVIDGVGTRYYFRQDLNYKGPREYSTERFNENLGYSQNCFM